MQPRGVLSTVYLDEHNETDGTEDGGDTRLRPLKILPRSREQDR